MPTVPSPVRHELAVRRLEVTSVQRLTPHMTRIRLGGDDLGGLVSLGPTDHIKLLVPGPGEAEPVLPSLRDGRIVFPTGTRPPMRDYTIRRHHPDSNEIDVDIAVHGRGHVSSWAESAMVGAVIGTGGPRGSHPIPVADQYALIGDASSLPAIGRWLEELPASATAQVLVAADEPEDEIELESRAAVKTHWVHDSSGVPADRLAEGLSLLDLSGDDLYVWAAGEVIALRSVRDRLRGWGLSEDQVAVDGYWRRGEADYDHHRPLDE